MALSVPQILQQFKADVAKALSAEPLTESVAIWVIRGESAYWTR